MGCANEEKWSFNTKITSDNCKYCEGAVAEAIRKEKHAIIALLTVEISKDKKFVMICSKNDCSDKKTLPLTQLKEGEFSFSEEIAENNMRGCVMRAANATYLLRILNSEAIIRRTVPLKIAQEDCCQIGLKDNQECILISEGTVKRE